MWEQAERILRQAMSQIADQVANFLPGVLVSLILLLSAVVVALVVRAFLVRALRGMNFDRWAEHVGLPALAGLAPPTTSSQIVARLAAWMIIVMGVLVSLTALNASMPSRLALTMFEYVPHLLAAILVLAVGTIAARMAARSVLIGAVNMQLQSARFLSLAVKWLVLLVTAAMALDHLGLGRSVLLLAFGILFGGIVLAAALAVGLGAKDAVGRAITRQLDQSPRADDRVNHV